MGKSKIFSSCFLLYTTSWYWKTHSKKYDTCLGDKQSKFPVNIRECSINASPEISIISQKSSENRKNSTKKILKSHV